MPESKTITRKSPSQNTATRRSMLKMGLGVSIIPIIGASCSNKAVSRALATPQQTEGPFYPVHQQQDKDVDLTRIEGRSEQAKGDVIHVRGKVYDTAGATIQNAFVEIWQANTWGRYRHHKDPSNAPIDPNFQGWGQTYTDEEGRYGFKTIMPGAYPAGPGWTRPPHIHFKAAMQDYYPLTTQMYFPGHELNGADLILQNLSSNDQNMVISKRQHDQDTVFIFDIVLRRAV